MAIAGETITHPVNGEQITFIRTSADTDGALTELEFRLPEGMIPCPEHVHPQATETLAVHEGALRVMIDGRLHHVGAGETIELAPGTAHTYFAVGDTRMTATYAPALGMDDFFIDLFAIAEAGDVDERGVPHHLPLMVLLDDYPDACYLATPTVAPQKETIRTLACSGRMHGYGRAHRLGRIAA